MNRFQRWVKRAGGEPLDRLSQRAAGVAVRRSGLRRRLRPGGELPKDELRRHFVEDHGEDGAPEAWRQRARRFLFGPRRGPALSDALGWLVPDDVWRVAVEGPVTGLERGEALLFDRRQASVGWPPDFGRDPLTGARWPTLKHWSDYDTLDPQLPDSRPIQELSRFTLAFHIGRHVVRSRDEAAAQRLWIMFEAWDTQNPYGLTVHWASGREASYRLFAWLFATVATLDSEATTAARLARVTERAWYVAHHAEGDLGRARSRRDLDVLAQSAALWTVGALFPEMRRAGAWERRGRETFEAEVLRQVDTDGTFLQRGPFEHRTLLDLVLWSARLGELTGVPLGEATLERLGAAFRWLVELTDPDSGAVPNFGVNDGTHLLPLSTCAYGDMRPTLQAMSFLLYRRRAFAEGPWDEKMLWLFGPDALDADVGAWPRRGSSLASGGYETFVGPRTWAAVRSGKPSRVPDQADMLHLDLWDGPRNVLRDAGVLQAGPAGRWVTYGSSTAAHNVVEIDGEDQMRRAPRQRWARAVRSRFLRRRRSDDGRVDVFAGEHEGYRRLAGTPVHRRSLIRLDDAWVVVDDRAGHRHARPDAALPAVSDGVAAR